MSPVADVDLRQGVGTPGRARIAARTLRRDRWWLQPLVTFVCFSAWLLYGLIRAATQQHYYVAEYGYLTPFASPCLSTSCEPGSAHFGTPFGEWPPLIPFAILSLPFLLLFRLTCYYYRKAYYRSFFWSPPACAVPDAHKKYKGESRFPLILQNVHRLFFYLVLPFPFILLYDAIEAFNFPDGFGMGLGTLILLVNAFLLGAYTASCHSCRHLCGGMVDVLSRRPRRYRAWKMVSYLNEHHMLIAWVSLVAVALTDVYVRLVANGTITDPRFF